MQFITSRIGVAAVTNNESIFIETTNSLIFCRVAAPAHQPRWPGARHRESPRRRRRGDSRCRAPGHRGWCAGAATRQKIRELVVSMNIDSLLVTAATPIRDVMNCIDRNAKGIALVVDGERHLIATVTDGDVRRAVLAGTNLDLPVQELLDQKATSQDSVPT